MTRFEPNLRIPGPTPLPPTVREAGGRQMINHRGPDFAALLGRIQAGMRPFFGTAGDIAILSCAGTGGLEAAIVNTLSPGDAVLGVSIGAFGDRFASIAEAYGAKVDRMAAEWGWAAAADEVRERLGRGEYRAVLVTHNETSTGVMNPLPELIGAIRAAAPGALILVDSVSALGAVPFEMDAWGADVVVTASQKAWMAAPGLAMVAASDRAWAAMATARMPRFYLDLLRHRKGLASGETPWTPAIAVVYQVEEGIRLMAEEGRAAVFARHAACAAATRAGLEALGFELFAEPAHRSQTVTAAHIPEGLDWKAFNAELRARGAIVAGGQGKLTGKVFRVGHLGSVTVDDILGLMATLEEASLQFGRDIVAGRAVAEAERAAVESHGLPERAVAAG
ncbi:MAG TPA: alanine--glyoxylate aminotransferase family protein [Candidatus Limnocylindrales bacterium]|nr:alanine--glyoxylate aminotransferase family protein [Candidatus Limnocylindrales bacterium]